MAAEPSQGSVLHASDHCQLCWFLFYTWLKDKLSRNEMIGSLAGSHAFSVPGQMDAIPRHWLEQVK